MIATVSKGVLLLSLVYLTEKIQSICGVFLDFWPLFFTLLGYKTISSRQDKLSLLVTVGEYDMACKIAHHAVTAWKIMGVTTISVDKIRCLILKSITYQKGLIAGSFLGRIKYSLLTHSQSDYTMNDESTRKHIIRSHYFHVSVRTIGFLRSEYYVQNS